MKIKNNSTFSRRSQPNRTVRISGLCSAAVLATAIAYKISNQWQEKKSPGTEAPLGQFPHVVILRNSSTKEHFCSGAIVGKRSILTAAHCVDGLEIVNFEVVAGTILNNVTSDEQNVYDVAQVTVHRDYKNLANDIAMVHTANDIRLSDDVKIVKVGAKLYPTGWCRYNGLVNSNQTTPKTNKLHYRETTTISQGECAQLVGSMGQFLIAGNLCTSNPIENGVCTADSGGPIVCAEHNLKGMFSWNGGCMAGKADVYTAIDTYSKWINDEIKKN